MKPALIVIDMINGSFDRWSRATRDALVENVNVLVRRVRQSGAPVIWIRQEFADDLSDAFLEMRDRAIRKYVRGTSECELLSELDVHEADTVLVKKRYSAFFGTNLDQRLEGRLLSHLILAGVNTHACIRTTAIDAYQRDWRVILAKECIASHDEEHHRVSMAYMDGKIGTPLSNADIAARLTK